MRIFIHQPVVDGATLTATYSHGADTYEHRFTLPVAPTDHTDPTFLRLCRWVATVHSLYLFYFEYFDEIATEFPLSKKEVAFFEKLIFNGLAEFRFVNNIPLDTRTTLQPSSLEDRFEDYTGPHLDGRLLLNGGGKDGLTSGALLAAADLPFTLFEVGSGVAQTRTAQKLAVPRLAFKREMDERRYEGKYRGHFPTSAAIAFSALLTAYVTGNREVIASNENSANEANLELNGIVVNHQYSKSVEFEGDLRELLDGFGLPLRYFSLLRPFHELQIIALFAQHPHLASSFISCNYGYRSGAWCKRCAKCAFIALAFSAVAPQLMHDIFANDQAVTSPELEQHIRELVQPESQKPLECVGTLHECQIAASLITKNPDISLHDSLKSLLTKESAHITPADVRALFTSFDAHHFAPEEYNAVLDSARKTLRTYTDSLTS